MHPSGVDSSQLGRAAFISSTSEREYLCGTTTRAALLEPRDAGQCALTSTAQMPDLDKGRASAVDHGPHGCTVIEGGLPAGYFRHALTRLLTVVSEAITAGVPLQHA